MCIRDSTQVVQVGVAHARGTGLRGQRTGYSLWPSEIETLQSLCADGSTGKVFAVDTAPSSGSAHMPWCALAFGALYCSCGADLTGGQYPLYEGGSDAWP